MKTLRIPSLEDIHQAHGQGEEAVVAVVMQMVAQHAELMAVVQQQQDTIGRLEDRVRTLEDQLLRLTIKLPTVLVPNHFGRFADATSLCLRS